MLQKAGDRGNTERRDAVPLARLMRSGPSHPSTSPRVRMKRCVTGAERVRLP
jgi:hypothetical protein